MGVVEARRNRLVLPVDMIWVRLADDKAIPLEVGVTTANMKAREFILTPKVGLRLLGTERVKIDALTGFRYWHLGESLKFSPSTLGLNFSRSQNWAHPLVGEFKRRCHLRSRSTLRETSEDGEQAHSSITKWQVYSVTD